MQKDYIIFCKFLLGKKIFGEPEEGGGRLLEGGGGV